MNKRLLILFVVLLTIFCVFSGCSKPNAAVEANIKITGFDDNLEIVFTPSDLKDLPVYDGKVEGADSEGNPVVYQVKGAYLKDLLEKNGKSLSDIQGLRMVATDGYSIDVQKDIIQNRDIILGYEMDGKPLDEKNAPLRVFIPEERAMYWVRMVSEFVVVRGKSAQDTACIYMLETLAGHIALEDYEFFRSLDKAINTEKFIEEYPAEGQDTILLAGADGLEKVETLDNLKKGVIKVTGKYAPMFVSDVLPVGMHVKDLLYFKYGANVFYAAAKGAEKYQPLTLKQVMDDCGMAAEQCTLVGETNQIDVAADDFENYSIKTENDVVSVYQDAEESPVIEGLLSINK